MRTQLISIHTTRYSAAFRRILTEYSAGIIAEIDGRVYPATNFPHLIEHWCTNERACATREFLLRRGDRQLFGFHDHPEAAGSVAAAESPENGLIGRARSILEEQGIDPATRKLSFRYYGHADRYFRGKPRTEFWDAGRRTVGERPVFAVSYSVKTPSTGGVGTFLFDAKTRKLLWAYRGR